MHSAFCGDCTNNVNSGDTTLRLDGFGYGSSKKTCFGNDDTEGVDCWSTCKTGPDDGCKLVLGLGPTPSAYSGKHSFSGPSSMKEIENMLNPGLVPSQDSPLKLGISGGAAGNAIEFSASSDRTDVEFLGDAVPVFGEGSTSAKTSGGYITTLILAPRMENSDTQLKSEPSGVSNYSMNAISDLGNPAVSSEPRAAKKCKFAGCTKGARGATGLCIGHGGGQRCQKPGCKKGAESRTAFCKAHGGGRRCDHLGCTKSAEGKTDHCIAHGGGRRCGHPEGCSKAARGKSGLCIRHGGGKRCKMDGCSRSAEGQVGLCISHGGGRRCQFIGCNKGAQGSTVFCKAHGGGKRCTFAGCSKGAEGSTPLCKGHGGGKRCMFDGGGVCPKSVHGGTNFCVAHGGGKRCAVSGCTKSARGRTDCCVKHGGGKRCQIESCGKSAQGSTEYCKAHGGGKRCDWGECDKFARGKSGLCAAHMTLLCPNKGGGVIMAPGGLFHGVVPSPHILIPDQVLVPPEDLVVTEGRVHGGGLLSLFRCNNK